MSGFEGRIKQYLLAGMIGHDYFISKKVCVRRENEGKAGHKRKAKKRGASVNSLVVLQRKFFCSCEMHNSCHLLCILHDLK